MPLKIQSKSAPIPIWSSRSVQKPKMFTFARFLRLVLRTSAESWSAPPGPAWWGRGAPPGSPLGDDLSFFFASIAPPAEAEEPVWASDIGALSPPAAPAEDEEEEEEEPASDFLLDSIMEDVGGLSWTKWKTGVWWNIYELNIQQPRLQYYVEWLKF